jgi:hypothetical protein
MSPAVEEDVRTTEIQKRRQIEALRRELYERLDPDGIDGLMKELQDLETELDQVETRREQEHPHDPAAGVIFDNVKDSRLLGAKSTGLEATFKLRMAYVPTSIAYLLDPTANPLVTCEVSNRDAANKIRRLRVISYLEGYSAQAIETVELDPRDSRELRQLPTIFPEQVAGISEATRASLNVLVEDIDSNRVELHRSVPVWLLPRTTALLYIQDPATGKWNDMAPYLGAYVTPNAPSIMKFLSTVYQRHPDQSLIGYQIGKQAVEPQVRAIFEALKTDAGIHYVNSVSTFLPSGGMEMQRVRLPRESLEDKEANCIDGTVLVASLLEAISLNAAIVLVPGHAFVAWETWDIDGEWRFLETTMIATRSFEDATAYAEKNAEAHRKMAQSQSEPSKFRLLPLAELRSVQGISPME